MADKKFNVVQMGKSKKIDYSQFHYEKLTMYKDFFSAVKTEYFIRNKK